MTDGQIFLVYWLIGLVVTLVVTWLAIRFDTFDDPNHAEEDSDSVLAVILALVIGPILYAPAIALAALVGLIYLFVLSAKPRDKEKKDVSD